MDLHLYGFVRPESGEVFWLILPTLNVELFSMALREFAEEVGAGESKRVLLVVDRAGWHTGGEVEIPEGIHLELLPWARRSSYAGGEVVAAEQRGVGQNGLFEEIEEVEEALVERCVELLDEAEAIRSLTNYYWWPQAA